MKQILKAFNAKLRLLKWIPGFIFALTLVLLSQGCSKSPAANERSEKNTNTGNANQQDQAVTAQPLLQPNFTGDIERASLAISMARDAVKLNKWQEAASQLQGARKEVEAALTRQSHLRDELEALRTAIDRAIPAIEGRAKEAEARIAELQTRIGALKVQAGQ